MKNYLFALCLCLGGLVLNGNAQNLALAGCDYTLETLNTPDGIPFYAVKDVQNTSNFGRVIFYAGSSGWEFKWSFNGNNRLDMMYAADSSYVEVNLQGNGVYSITAEKVGETTLRSGDFRVFYVHVPDFKVRLDDVDNCEEIKMVIEDFHPAFYDNGGVLYYGTKNVEYLLSGKQVPWSFTDYQLPTWEIPVKVTYKNATFNITITDKFGFDWKSADERYSSVIPKAAFSVTPDQGEAPLEVNFNNQSINAQVFEWYLYKDTAMINPGSFTLEDSLMDERIVTDESFAYTYEHPGSYNVKLFVYNTAGVNRCSDSMTISKYIVVDSSLLTVPNVFTPNGDGINDVFRVKKAVSLSAFRGVIINRWGRTVFEWGNPEEGWDGRIGGKLASPGTYFYIITARGREVDARKYIKKGALLLIR